MCSSRTAAADHRRGPPGRGAAIHAGIPSTAARMTDLAHASVPTHPACSRTPSYLRAYRADLVHPHREIVRCPGKITTGVTLRCRKPVGTAWPPDYLGNPATGNPATSATRPPAIRPLQQLGHLQPGYPATSATRPPQQLGHRQPGHSSNSATCNPATPLDRQPGHRQPGHLDNPATGNPTTEPPRVRWRLVG